MADRYVPAAGRESLNSYYDAGVKLTMREKKWRPLIVDRVAAEDPDTVVDIGCGTGTLALALAQRLPRARVVGVDGDRDILDKAMRKPGAERVEWFEGRADSLPFADGEVGAVVISLVLHHLQPEAKRAALTEAHRVLRPGGHLFIADFGKPQDPIMSAAFLAVQVLDGFGNTAAHRRGEVTTMLEKSGFRTPQVLRRIRSGGGSFEVLAAEKKNHVSRGSRAAGLGL